MITTITVTRLGTILISVNVVFGNFYAVRKIFMGFTDRHHNPPRVLNPCVERR